jgi:hypothetical protein
MAINKINMRYFDINFVNTNHLGYKKWGRRYARITRLSKGGGKKDSFDVAFNKELITWEKIIQTLLSRVVLEDKNRILQYRTQSGSAQYREIDFIAKVKDRMVLCEIKLKRVYKDKIGDSRSGWKQLNKSIDISCHKYSNIAGLAICVDMSFLYGIDCIIDDDVYCKYNNIKKYFDIASSEKKIIWLNSLDMAKLAVKLSLISIDEVESMKRIFNEKNNPLSTLKEDNNISENKPFKALLKKI